MHDDKEIKRVLELRGKHHLYSEADVEPLFGLAQAYLDVKGLPEKAVYDHDALPEGANATMVYDQQAHNNMCSGFNQALSLCRLAIAKGYIRRGSITFKGHPFGSEECDKAIKELGYIKRDEVEKEKIHWLKSILDLDSKQLGELVKSITLCSRGKEVTTK